MCAGHQYIGALYKHNASIKRSFLKIYRIIIINMRGDESGNLIREEEYLRRTLRRISPKMVAIAFGLGQRWFLEDEITKKLDYLL